MSGELKDVGVNGEGVQPMFLYTPTGKLGQYTSSSTKKKSWSPGSTESKFVGITQVDQEL